MGIDWRNAIWPDDRVRRFLHLLLLLYFLKQIFIAFTMPAFTGHDEVAHFQYIRTVATEYRLPIIPDLEFWRENREQDGPKTGAISSTSTCTPTRTTYSTGSPISQMKRCTSGT